MAVPVASTEKQVCLGCGEVTQKRNRRVLGSTSEQVAILWKDVISKELELRRQQINLDNLLHPGRSYMCRRCYHAYDKLLQAKKV